MNKSAQSASTIVDFAHAWVSSNVYKAAAPSDVPREVERLAAKMTADARAQGISGGDLARSVGDIDDYLTAQVEMKEPAPCDAGST